MLTNLCLLCGYAKQYSRVNFLLTSTCISDEQKDFPGQVKYFCLDFFFFFALPSSSTMYILCVYLLEGLMED